MSKILKFWAWSILSAIVMMVLFVGCGKANEPTNIPLSTPTNDWEPLPTYVHHIYPIDELGFIRYIPSEKSKMPLEFDYPISWFFTEHIGATGIPIISLSDPRFLTLPTPDTAEVFPHPVPNDFGSILIWNIPSKSGRTVESEVEDQKQRYRNREWATFLDEYTIAIDGFGAKVIEHQIQAPETHTSLMFERRIYFFAENEIYAIFFEIAEKDRGGEFEQGYEIFINSLKVIRQK